MNEIGLLREGRAEGTYLLLHGFAGAPENWSAALAALPPGPAVRAPLLPGHGPGASTPDPRLSFEEHARRFLDSLGPPPPGGFRVAGYSLGARVALALLVRKPEAFRSALLIGVHPGLSSDEERRERAEWEEGWAALLETEGIEPFVREWERLPLFASQRRAAPAARDAQRRARLRHDPAALAGAMRALGLSRMPDRRPNLRPLSLPVLLAAGDGDERFVRLGRETAALLPRGRFRPVPGSGHNPLLERPGETARLLHSLP